MIMIWYLCLTALVFLAFFCTIGLIHLDKVVYKVWCGIGVLIALLLSVFLFLIPKDEQPRPSSTTAITLPNHPRWYYITKQDSQYTPLSPDTARDISEVQNPFREGTVYYEEFNAQQETVALVKKMCNERGEFIMEQLHDRWRGYCKIGVGVGVINFTW